MLLIRCPYCGPRGHVEFTYGGDASRRRPDTDGPGSEEAWFDYVYLRDNPAGPQLEHWQHSGGCRAWLVIERDTASHAISSVRDAGGDPA